MSVDVDKKRVSLRRAVDQYSEALVNKAGKTMSKQRVQEIKKIKNGLKTSQLNNLLGVAMETNSPAVVINWIRYQMARRETKRGWRGQVKIGDYIVKDLEKLEKTARKVAEEAFGNAGEEHLRQAHIALVRRYAGYLKRWFVARGGSQQ